MTGEAENLPDGQLEVFDMLYFGLFPSRADDGDDIKAPRLLNIPIVQIMVDRPQDVALFSPIDSLLRSGDDILATCLHLDEHQPLVVLCNYIDVTMARVSVALQNNISFLAQVSCGQLLTPCANGNIHCTILQMMASLF